MTRQVTQDEVDRVRNALARTLGTAHERLGLVAAPLAKSRSTLFFFGAEENKPEFVVKTVVHGNTAIDTTPALSSAEQFRALELAHRWFEAEDRHAAVRPLYYLDELDAVVMEFVHGRPFRRTVRRGVVRPDPALRAAAAAGDALRRLHRHGQVEEAPVDLGELVDEVRATEAAMLHPVGVRLPGQVAEVLDGVPRRRLPWPRAVQHGDFAPVNLILLGADEVTIIDPSLTDVGLPEDDLARFLAVLSSYSVFVAEHAVVYVGRFRRELERAFRFGYGAAETQTAVMELRLLKQHVLRWRRRREFSRLTPIPPLMHGRERVIDRHMRLLVTESAQRLAGFVAQPLRGSGG